MRLKASDIINGSLVPGKSGLYVLGCYDDRITFFSQQVRALNLIWALKKQEFLSQATRVAVVGGGAAGVTAAAAIALVAKTINVDLYESRPELLELQSVSTRRSLDPHIYGWPEMGATFSNADLPILDWQAGPVRDVRNSVLTGFLNIDNAVSPRLKVKQNHRVTGLSEVTSGFSLTIAPPGGTTETVQYDVVFLAFGFGTEPSSIHGLPVESYWSDAGIPEKDLSGTETPTFIISGSGDGSLIDLVASATKTFDHAGMIRFISKHPGIETVAVELTAIEEEMRAKEVAGVPYDVFQEYNARILPKLQEIGILIAVQDSLRPNLNLILQTRSSVLFHLQTSILNRLAAYIVVTIYTDKCLFRHINALDLIPSSAQVGEDSFPLWFVCDGERLGANKVFFRRGTGKESIRAPFETLLSRYPDEHLKWLAKHGTAVQVPRLLDEARILFKELAVRYGLPRAQYLETAYPTNVVQIQLERYGANTVWSGDLTPQNVASVWNNEITDARLFCRNTPGEFGCLALAIARIAIHASNLSLFGNKQAWESFLEVHTKFSDTSEDMHSPRTSPLGMTGTQQGMQSIQSEHLAHRLHAAMDRWILDHLHEDISSFLDTAEDPSHTIGFEIEINLRKMMLAEWQDWQSLLASSQDRLARFLRLIVCAQESQASSGGNASVSVGPKRYKHIIKTTVAALAIASAWKKMSPADHVPGNLHRVQEAGVKHSGFACAADRISGLAVVEACTSFDWATDFVLLPMQTGSLMIEGFAQEALTRIDTEQPLMNEISAPARVLVSADREFTKALKSGTSQLEAFLRKKESQTYKRLSSAIVRYP